MLSISLTQKATSVSLHAVPSPFADTHLLEFGDLYSLARWLTEPLRLV